MCRVLIPSLLRPLTGGAADVEASGGTVGEVIQFLDTRFPGLSDRLLVNGRLRPGISVAVDGVVSPRGVREVVKPGGEVIFIAALSGG